MPWVGSSSEHRCAIVFEALGDEGSYVYFEYTCQSYGGFHRGAMLSRHQGYEGRMVMPNHARAFVQVNLGDNQTSYHTVLARTEERPRRKTQGDWSTYVSQRLSNLPAASISLSVHMHEYDSLRP